MMQEDLFKRVDGFKCSQIEDGYVLYDVAHEIVHYLNVTAAGVLELCDGHNDARTIATLLQNAFHLPEPPLDDVAACLISLRASGLIAPAAQP